jgi:peptide/nickel transport system substrate-binding protein
VSNPVPLGDLKRLEKNPRLSVTFEDEGIALSVYFNTRNPIFSDRRVRQALLHAIDRRFVSDTVYQGFAKPCAQPAAELEQTLFHAGRATLRL